MVPESFSRQGDHLSREASEAVQPPGMASKQGKPLGLRGWAFNQPVLEILVPLIAQIADRRIRAAYPVLVFP